MELVKILLIIIAFFLGLAFLVHICSKHKYSTNYTSQKRKIEIYPSQPDKSHPIIDKGSALIFYNIILTLIYKIVNYIEKRKVKRCQTKKY